MSPTAKLLNLQTHETAMPTLKISTPETLAMELQVVMMSRRG